MMSGAFRNGAALAGGRILLSGARMLAALCVARLSGAHDFGAYALLLSLVGLAEWLVDFGQTDIAVRDMARRPGRRAALLAALGRAKRAQGPIIAMGLPSALWVTGQGSAMVLAGCAGAVAILAVAWLQPARASLRADLRMDREVGAELAGTVVMLPLLLLACLAHGPLWSPLASASAGRAVQAMLTRHWAGPFAVRHDARVGAAALARQAAPLGMAGLMVLLYDALAPLLLATMADLRAVALYAAAARFVFPGLIAVQAIGTAFFPLLARAWPRDRATLARAQQQALLVALAVSAPLFAGLHGGARFLMGLLGPDFVGGAELLRLMAWLLLARAVTTVMSPLILVGRRQLHGMALTALSLAAQVLVLLLLVPQLGVMGAGVGYLVVELLLGTLAVSWIGQRAAGIILDWRPAAAFTATAAGVALLVDRTPLAGRWSGGALAMLLVIAAAMFVLRTPLRRPFRWMERPA
jgi:O-antigen/teichoic acid export membrane protein